MGVFADGMSTTILIISVSLCFVLVRIRSCMYSHLSSSAEIAREMSLMMDSQRYKHPARCMHNTRTHVRLIDTNMVSAWFFLLGYVLWLVMARQDSRWFISPVRSLTTVFSAEPRLDFVWKTAVLCYVYSYVQRLYLSWNEREYVEIIDYMQILVLRSVIQSSNRESSRPSVIPEHFPVRWEIPGFRSWSWNTALCRRSMNKYGQEPSRQGDRR